jgi:hypothetical protein
METNYTPKSSGAYFAYKLFGPFAFWGGEPFGSQAERYKINSSLST